MYIVYYITISILFFGNLQSYFTVTKTVIFIIFQITIIVLFVNNLLIVKKKTDLNVYILVVKKI